MKKIIIFLFLYIIILGIVSCNGENKTELSSDESEYIHNEEDDYIGTFSYDRYIEYSKNGGFQIDSNKFNNTTETEIKSKEDVIKLAKNELISEYNFIDVYYDESNSMWFILFSIDYLNGQHIFIDNKGITKLITYAGSPFVGDSDILQIYYDVYAESLENTGGILVDPGRFKNTTETEIKTKEDVIELAKNEIDQTKEYDKITVYYDEVDSMWAVAFWLYDKYHMGQYVFIDSKGITKLVIYGDDTGLYVSVKRNFEDIKKNAVLDD